MEVSLRQLMKEANKNKHSTIQKTCQDVIEMLENADVVRSSAPYQLREKCLIPVQLALESKSSRLCVYAIACIQNLITDERFQSNMKCEEQANWFPMQVLSTVHNTSTLPDVVQIDIMRLLLNMAMTSSWCLNAPVIVAIIKLCMTSLTVYSGKNVQSIVVNLFLRIIHTFADNSLSFFTRHKIMVESSAGSGSSSVRTAATATFTQLLSTLSTKLHSVANVTSAPENADVAEFTSNNQAEAAKSLCDDYMTILNHLCDKLETNRSCQVAPLLLEGVLIMLSGAPPLVTQSPSFHDLVWQKLCPALIHALANPQTDKTLGTKGAAGGVGCGTNGNATNDEIGRGSGCSNAAPNIISSSARAIYSIAVELVRSVGRVSSLNPVIESLFHRILLYHPPVHRLDALKALQPLMSSPLGLLVLAGPCVEDSASKSSTVLSSKRKNVNQLSLLKLIVDSLQECCHCNDSAVVIASVNLVNDLLKSIEQLIEGGEAVLEQGEATHNVKTEASDIDENRSKIGLMHSGAVSHVPTNEESLSKNDGGMNASRTSSALNATERTSSSNFMVQLRKLLDTLDECSEAYDVDLRLQDFASRFCEDHSMRSVHNAVLNADAVYVTVCSVLHLSCTLRRLGYFSSREKSLPMSEQQFVDDILGMGLLLYVSRPWLCEVFHQVIAEDVFRSQQIPAALIALLADIDGFDCQRVKGQLLSIYRDDDCHVSTSESDNIKEAFNCNEDMLLLGRLILTTCWDGVLDVLSVLISGRSSCGITGSLALMFNAKEESRKARLAICTSLEGLQTATRLSNVLGLHEQCSAVFEHLAAASCVLELDDIKRERQQQQPAHQLTEKKPAAVAIAAILPSSSAGASSRQRLARLHAAHALCMEVLLEIGLEMGSHTAACWKHVFRCCAHVSELEHTYFSSGDNKASLTKLAQSESSQTPFNKENLDENDDSCLYPSLSMGGIDTHPAMSVTMLIQESSAESSWDNQLVGGGVLTPSQSSKVLCRLSHDVDRLFEDAAVKLNLKALIGFLSELCVSSRHQLSAISKRSAVDIPTLPSNTLLLHRFDDILSKCINSDRPLLHTMRIWNVVAPHLVEAACHHDGAVSKRAVDCIHNAMTKLLSSYSELPHFHFNESLCKPFENLLCLELCDGDIQDQIVCSICELVEACTTNIKSGWKPLFGALRAVKIQYTANEQINEARQRHIFAVLDVFDVFLATDNIGVFANAAIDCILCLLKYVRGPGEFEMKDTCDSSDSEDDETGFDSSLNLCLPALHYLRQCCDIIATMHRMPNCPVFDGAYRIHVGWNRPLECVTATVDLEFFCNLLSDKNELRSDRTSEVVNSDAGTENRSNDAVDGKPDVSSDTCAEIKELTPRSESVCAECEISGKTNSNQDQAISVERPSNASCSAAQSSTISAAKVATSVDRSSVTGVLTHEVDVDTKCENQMTKSQLVFDRDHSGTLPVYFLVIEGLSSTVSACPKNYQPQTLEKLFELMRLASRTLGAEFALHCVGALLLPMMQSWLRRGNGNTSAATGAPIWDSTTVANFKHYAGLCIDLVVEFVIEFAGNADLAQSIELMLQQQLGILVDCIGQPLESISRLGCSCIRHCLLNCGAVLTEPLWWLAAKTLSHAFDVTLYPLRQLTMPFHENSDNFCGDVGHVKVAVRQDSTGAESARLQQIAQQVFLLESQNSSEVVINSSVDSDKSYVFLFYSSSSSQSRSESMPIARVPFRNLVVGLMSHQLLLQTVGSLLLSGSNNVVPAEQGIFVGESTPCHQNAGVPTDNANLMSNRTMPGLMSVLSSRVIFALLQCLRSSYHAAVHFDSRPGLKFLVQKVSGANVAANLYKQAGVAYTLYMHTLLEVSVKLDDLSSHNVRRLLGSCDEGCDIDGESLEADTNCRKQLLSAQQSTQPVVCHVPLFVHLLKSAYDETCSRYIDLFLEQEGPNAADRLSERSLLVFLPDDEGPLPQIPRERSLSEMVADKLRRRQSTESVTSEQPSPQSPEAALKPPLSPISSTPRSHKALPEDRIYTVATDRTINSVVKEYRKHKQAQLMPKPSGAPRTSKSTGSGQAAQANSTSKSMKDPIDQQIEEQQRSSIMKDGEAHLRSSVELLCNMLQLLDHVPTDIEFRALLPTAFACVTRLVGYCRDRQLREALARLTFRVGSLFEISAPGDVFSDLKY